MGKTITKSLQRMKTQRKNTASKRVIRKSISKRQKKTRKTRRFGGSDIIPIIKNYLKNKINIDNNEQCIFKNCSNPGGKSEQVINVCDNGVYKRPPHGYADFSDLEISLFKKMKSYRVIKVNPHTMNLFIQSIFKDFEIGGVEKYEKICKVGENEHAMQSIKYGYTHTHEKSQSQIFNLTTYVGVVGADSAENVLAKMKGVNDKLQDLYDKFRFHHCDPKADQIFIEKDGRGNINFILGDLDKVTFTLKYEDHLYRVRLHTPVHTLKSKFKVPKIKFAGGLSASEWMRYDDYPRSHCDFEKCAFLASLFLNANDDLYNALIAIMNENVNDFYENLSINKNKSELDMGKILSGRKNEERKGHKLATRCVINNDKSYASSENFGGIEDMKDKIDGPKNT